MRKRGGGILIAARQFNGFLVFGNGLGQLSRTFVAHAKVVVIEPAIRVRHYFSEIGGNKSFIVAQLIIERGFSIIEVEVRVQLVTFDDLSESLGTVSGEAEEAGVILVGTVIAWSQSDRVSELPLGACPIPLIPPPHDGKRFMGLAYIGVQLQGPGDGLLRTTR